MDYFLLADTKWRASQLGLGHRSISEVEVWYVRLCSTFTGCTKVNEGQDLYRVLVTVQFYGSAASGNQNAVKLLAAFTLSRLLQCIAIVDA